VEKRFKVGLPDVVVVFDEATRRRLREISRKKAIDMSDILFVVDTARKRKQLFQRANPSKPMERFVKSAARGELGDAVARILDEFEKHLWKFENRDKILQMDLAEALRERRRRASTLKKHGGEPETIVSHSKVLPPDKIAEATGIPEKVVSAFLRAHQQYNELLEEYYEHSDKYGEFLNKIAEILAEEPTLFHIYKERKKNVHPKLENAYNRALEIRYLRNMGANP